MSAVAIVGGIKLVGVAAAAPGGFDFAGAAQLVTALSGLVAVLYGIVQGSRRRSRAEQRLLEMLEADDEEPT